MSDENQVEDTSSTQVETSPVEQEAIDRGWVPKDQYQGDEHKWIDAGEFLRRAPLFDKIDQQNRKIKQLDDGIKKLASHHDKVREVEYQRAFDELKRQKRTAIEDGDVDAQLAIDDKILEVREAQRVAKMEEATKPQEAPNPEFVSWQERNSWYASSRPMRAFADDYGIDLAKQGYDPKTVLKMVEQEVKKEFAHKFRNPNNDKPSAVEGAKPSTKTKSGNEETLLNDTERKIMNTLIKTIPGFTKDKYIADLKKVDTEGRFK